MNPEKKDDRSESYFMVGGSQVTLRSGGIWLGPSGPLFFGRTHPEFRNLAILWGDLNRWRTNCPSLVNGADRNGESTFWPRDFRRLNWMNTV